MKRESPSILGPATVGAYFIGIGTLIKQNRLGVPANQREYSWDDPEISSLLDDFSKAISTPKQGAPASYFLGTILLTQSKGDRPQVADGQQRLATTTILLAAIRDFYDANGEENLAKSIEGDFLFNFDRRAKDDVPRLRLNVDDREFFKKRILERASSKERIEASTKRALRLFVNWSVRFLITGGRGGFLDKHYSQAAHAIGKGEIATAQDLIDHLEKKEVLPPDGAFRTKFATATVSRAYWARYYLRALELQAKGDPEPELIPNPAEEIVNLEHVLPVNPSSDWIIDEDVAVGYYRRLGNLALLQVTSNGALSNGPFSEKKKTYRQSAFFLTSMIAKEKDWGPKQINKRQELLAELAVKTWPLKIK